MLFVGSVHYETIVVTSGGLVGVWNGKSDDKLDSKRSWTLPAIHAADLALDGRHLALASQGNIYIFRVPQSK